jgi:spermidine synthase
MTQPAPTIEPTSWKSCLAITAAGFASAVAQILTVRELLVLFYGNELSVGLVFTSWLLWTALGSSLGGRYSRRVNPTAVTLALVLAGLALVVPATLLWIRASRMIWSIPLGELLSPGKMLAIALTTTGPLCITNGLLFALAWAVQAAGTGVPCGLSYSPPNDESPPLDPVTQAAETSHFVHNQERFAGQPLLIYLGEAAGASLGGLCLYFFLLPRAAVLTTACILSLLLWVVAGVLLSRTGKALTAVELVPDAANSPVSSGQPVRVGGLAATVSPPPERSQTGKENLDPTALRSIPPQRRCSRRIWGLWLLAGFGLFAAGARLDSLDRQSRSWQWGPNLAAGYDTPYHNLSVIRQPNQISVFVNGLWWFSAPDPETAELSVHIAMLEHPKPHKVLLVGSGITGLVGEILKHPMVTSLDYVEADPQVISLIAPHLSDRETAPLSDPRLRLLHMDAGSFLRQCRERYDVVLLHCGDPTNLEINRFFTVEFYRRVARVLERGGVLSFAVGASADIVGPVQARFLRSLRASLLAVFPEVLVFPGGSARFLASNQVHSLSVDPDVLVQRLRGRGLQIRYVREDTLEDALNPFRLQALDAILGPEATAREPLRAAPINQDFLPVCHFHNLLLWGAQLHPHVLQGLLAMQRYHSAWLWAGVLILVLTVMVLMSRSRSRPGPEVGFNVAVVGGSLMGTQIVLLLAFQVFAGFLYRQVALIVSLFMVGMALGAAVVNALAARPIRARVWLATCQGMLCLFLIVMVELLQAMHGWLEAPGGGPADSLLVAVFSVLALFLGFLGGIHFSLAVRVQAGATVASARIGGGLYGLDLLGAAFGALMASLFLIPLYGIITTIHIVAAGTGISLLALLRGREQGPCCGAGLPTRR